MAAFGRCFHRLPRVQVAQGMAGLEGATPPIVHRDLKPSNVFVDAGGGARVADMNLSLRLHEDCLANLTGETGTYLYMSPEMMRHEVRPCDLSWPPSATSPLCFHQHIPAAECPSDQLCFVDLKLWIRQPTLLPTTGKITKPETQQVSKQQECRLFHIGSLSAVCTGICS